MPPFFKQIAGERHDDVAIVLVSHIFPGRDVYFDELNRRGDLAMIVPKGSSDNPATYDEFGNAYNLQLNKKEVKDIGKIISTFKEHIDADKKVIIFDHGGYFAKHIPEVQEALNGRVIGIIENTQNGHDKYTREKPERITVPIVSIADCKLKNHVEQSIGASIVVATESVLRDHGVALHDKKSLVLGYGKVGEAVTYNLAAGTTQVYDVDSLAKIRARQNKHGLVKKDERIDALKKADVIFCAGGYNSLQENDYQHLKDGAFISTVTSRDDSLHMPPDSYKLVRMPLDRSPIYKYVHQETGKTVNLLNDGNSANFIDQKPAVGSSMLAIQGLEIAAFEQIYTERDTLKKSLQHPSIDRQEQVADVWIDMF